MHISIQIRVLIVSVVFVISQYSGAGTLEQEMTKASEALTELMPFIYNDEAFRKQKNKTEIAKHLNSLVSVVEQTPNLISDHAVAMEISQQSLLRQLKQSQQLFQTQSYATAQYLLSGVPMICSSCHIQDGQQAKLTRKMDRSLFANDFSYGEFNYYLRNYTQAQSAYQKHITKGSIQKSRIQASKTLERLLDIAILTHDDTGPAKAMLTTNSALPKLDMEVKQKIELWQQGLSAVEPGPTSLDELEKAIYENFNEDFTLQHEFIFEEKNRPLALSWRKQLHQQLRKTESDVDTARTLYLLSIMERTLGDQIDVSLANLYLKECIQLAVAKYSNKCFSEYENHLHFYFGGSAGENLPPEVLNDLKQLKQNLVKDI